MDQKRKIVLKGVVRKNLGRGRKLGFPTANIFAPADTPEGIFVGVTRIHDESYPSLIFIGASVTFDEHDRKAEVYILDFDKDIYGTEILVHIHKKIRDNKKFDSVEALIAQIKIDVIVAREYFSRTVLIEFVETQDKKSIIN